MQKKVNDLEAKTGVKISGLGYYPNPLTPDAQEAETYIEHIKKVITASKLIGINQTNTFIGRDWKKSVDENWPQFLKVLETANSIRRRSGCPHWYRKLPDVFFCR